MIARRQPAHFYVDSVERVVCAASTLRRRVIPFADLLLASSKGLRFWIEIDRDLSPDRIADAAPGSFTFDLLLHARVVYLQLGEPPFAWHAEAYCCGERSFSVLPARASTNRIVIRQSAQPAVQHASLVRSTGFDVWIRATRQNVDDWLHVAMNATANSRGLLVVFYNDPAPAAVRAAPSARS